MTAALWAAAALAGPGMSMSVETDPAFWVGAAANGPAIDLNVDFTARAAPGLRFGAFGWSGRWDGPLARAVILPSAFAEQDWAVRWSGIGAEVQFQHRIGRSELGPGMRVQWSHFRFDRGGMAEATADHAVWTPQFVFQWFPVPGWGLYLLPWAGVQVPVAGTREVQTAEGRRDTRRLLPVVTAHVGWSF